MAEPGTTICAACNRPFVCREGDILHCDCYTVNLTPEAREWIAARYTDCICVDCLKAIAARFAGGQTEPPLH